jgi:uncharacterized SAM-binding protein YcdF (DUF218 family)
MKFARRIVIAAVVSGAWLLALGFITFALMVSENVQAAGERADGIVVLTGGAQRIQEGANLLKRGLGERLLISGVNAQTGQADVRRIAGLDAQKFECCVDLGYTALDTAGNAWETRTWAKARNYNKLIVVTSNYHMPRSLLELSRVLPGVILIPHPVTPKSFNTETWWLSPMTARNLLAEYVKLLPSAVRLAASRAFGPLGGHSIAEAGTPAGPQI